MKYTDTELWKLEKKELDMLKVTLTFDEFCQWSVHRLSSLIDESTKLDDWMEPEIKILRNYRVKARDKFFLPKIVKG
jgi:hypothetical protein